MEGEEAVQPDTSPASPESDIKKLKRANKVLKQAVLEERGKSAELTARVRQLEVVGTGKDEEIQQVGFHNNRLKKRVDALQQELEGQKPSAGSGWGLGAIGWGSTLSKADAEKLQADLGMMQEQLELKIRENESLHMEMFELKDKQEAQVEKLKKKNRELKAELESEKKRAEESLLAAAVRSEMLAGERDGAVRLQEAAEARLAESDVALAELRREHDAAVAAAEAEQGVLQRSVAMLEGQVADGATQRRRLSDALAAEERAKSELSDRYRELQSLYDAAEHSASLEREAMEQLRQRLAAARAETEIARADVRTAQDAAASAAAAAAAAAAATEVAVADAGSEKQGTAARANDDGKETLRSQVPQLMHPAEMERSWSNLSRSAGSSSQLDPRQHQLLLSTPAAGDMDRSGSGRLGGNVAPPSASTWGGDGGRVTDDDDDWDSELRQEFGSPSELPDQLTELSVASEEHRVLDAGKAGVALSASSIGTAAARLAAAEAAALAPHTGLMRVTDPSGAVQAELRLSAEGASREAALREYYAGKIASMRAAMERADARAVRSHADHLTTMDTLQDYVKRCDELLEATVAAQGRAASMEDALSTAQRGYDEQIAIMTEHMVGMNDRAKQQEEQFQPLARARVLCGVCKKWNSVGDLMSMEGGRGGARCLHSNHRPEGFDGNVSLDDLDHLTKADHWRE